MSPTGLPTTQLHITTLHIHKTHIPNPAFHPPKPAYLQPESRSQFAWAWACVPVQPPWSQPTKFLSIFAPDVYVVGKRVCSLYDTMSMVDLYAIVFSNNQHAPVIDGLMRVVGWSNAVECTLFICQFRAHAWCFCIVEQPGWAIACTRRLLEVLAYTQTIQKKKSKR